MRLNVQVEYGEARMKIVVPCGSGEQSVKWLATVATQRFGSDHAPHGRVRSRDTMCVVPSNQQLQPSLVCTEDDDFFHPEAKVGDCFVDGQSVRVVIAPRAKVDEAGEPIQTRWQIIANTHSEARLAQRAAALEEEERVRDTKLRQREHEAEERKLEDNRTKATLMRELIRQQLPSREQLETLMRKEWEHMNRRGLMDAWIRADREKEKVFSKLKENLLSVLELFRFYGASTTGANDAHLMEFVEFCAFCRDVDLFGGNNDLINHTTLAGAFAECAGVDIADVKRAHFAFGDFLASLIWLALATKGGLGTKKPKSSAVPTSKEAIDSARRTLMRTRDVSQVGSAFSTSNALQQLFDDNLSQAFRTRQSQLIGPITKEKLATDEILAIFYVHRQQLQDVYATYLGGGASVVPPPDSDDFDVNVGYMTMNEYVVLLEDSKLIGSSGGDDDHDLLTMKEVRQAFAGAQDDVVVDDDAAAAKRPPPAATSTHKQQHQPQDNNNNNSNNNNNNNIAAAAVAANATTTTTTTTTTKVVVVTSQSQLLSFAEFLEVVLRLALLKWDGDALTTAQKVTMAIKAILSNAFNIAEARPAPSSRPTTSKRK